MRKKIFWYGMVLIAAGLVFAGSFTYFLAKYFYVYEVKEKLRSTAGIIEYQITNQYAGATDIDYNKMAKDMSNFLSSSSQEYNLKESKIRITFIDFQGNVLGESDTDYKSMENHLNRKEIQEALTGEVGEESRYSQTIGMDFLYVAHPIKASQLIIRVSVPLTQVENINTSILIFTIIGIITGLAIITLLALWFSNTVTKPIKELINASGEISKGNYTKMVTVESGDELGKLAETFNTMAARLNETVAEMMDKNIKVDSIINSMTSGIIAVDAQFRIMLANSIGCEMFGIKYGPGVVGINIWELIRNNHLNAFIRDTIENNESYINEITIASYPEKVLRIYTNPIKSKDNNSINSGAIAAIQDITNIRKLEQIRTEFVSNVTHELKTPLTSIRGFIETLRGGAINDGKVADKFLEIIDIEAERLYILISDILQLSEIETMKKDSNIGHYELKPIVDEIFSILQSSAEKKEVQLTNDVSENLPIVVNKDRMKQMLINLIDNAIKYNVENGRVLVSAHKTEGKIIISVKDTGIGMSEEHVPRIFERFYRVDKGRSRNMGGTGLGLSIVKHIVNLYGGDIKVSSELGKGTEFSIQLPG